MLDEPLPADLEPIERDFTSLMQFDVEAAFGRRIASAVRKELLRERSAARWKFTLALAAGALIWIHLSFYAASVTDFHFRDSRPTTPTARFAGEFPAVLLGLPPDEARRQPGVLRPGADCLPSSEP